MKYLSRVEKFNIVDLNLAFKSHIEPYVEEDDCVYQLRKKSTLLRRFILYRMSSFLLEQIKLAKTDGAKLVLFLDKNLELDFLQDHILYVKNTTKLLSNLLGITIYKSGINLKSFSDIVAKRSGEGIELHNKLKLAMHRTKKISSLQTFYNLLSKNNIHKIQDSVRGDMHLKLGLFVT